LFSSQATLLLRTLTAFWNPATHQVKSMGWSD
jgi:hypothetical protein